MALKEKIVKDLTSAMKAKATLLVSTLRLVKTSLDKQEKDHGPLGPDIEQRILSTLVNQRKESAKLYRLASRFELAEKEEAEKEIIESYMDELASEEEMEQAILRAIESSGNLKTGKIISIAKGYLSGKRIDGKKLAQKAEIYQGKL